MMGIRGLAGMLLAWSLAAQSPIRGPMLGFVWDARQEALRPVLGIAGSSTLGKAVDLAFPVKRAAISPNQDFALVLGGEEHVPYAVDLRTADVVAARLEGTAEKAERLVLSTQATAAGILYTEPKKLVILGGLPLKPEVRREIDLSVDGIPDRLAVSDDGAAVIAAYSDSKALVRIDGSGNVSRFPEEISVRGLAFLENRGDAVVASNRGVGLFSADQTFTILHDSISSDAVSSSAEGKRVLIAESGSATVVEVSIETGEKRSVDCPCEPSSVTRISPGIFRLNEVSRSPLWLVEVLESGLRTLFVPPDPSQDGGE
jgi:hypothetical protein